MDEASQLGKLKAEPNNWNSEYTKAQHNKAQFWKLSLTLYLDHIYNMAPNFGDKEIV